MILDSDLLMGRDITTGILRTPADIARRLGAAGIGGGAISSLRAISHDPASGNREAESAADEHGWIPVPAVDLRNPIEAGSLLEQAASRGVRMVRFPAARQGIGSAVPRLRILARHAADLGLTMLVEGSTRTVGTALMGLDASVVLLDQHFYDVGEFILVAREEPGFHASTRLLGSPDAWEQLVEHLGAERLVLGTRAGWFEEAAVMERLETSGLTAAQRELVTSGNLRRLAEGTAP